MRFFVLLFILFPLTAWSRFYDVYRADFVKGSFCSVIAGACAADTDFDSSFFENPASLTAGGQNWDYDFDYITGNNLEPPQRKVQGSTQNNYMMAYASSTKKWGWGLSLTLQSNSVQSQASFYDNAAGAPVLFNSNTSAKTVTANVPFSFHAGPLDYGFALNTLWQSSHVDVSGSNNSVSTKGDRTPAFGLTLGAMMKLSPHYRFGFWVKSPMTYYYTQHISTSSAFSQFSYDEDYGINTPAQVDIGTAFTPWADKRTFFFDLNVIGTTPNGYMLSYNNFSAAAGSSSLTPKGRKTVVDPRFGMKLPWWKRSNGTVSLGSYYENPRWAGYSGLWHLTGGLSYNFPHFKFLIFDGVEIMAGIDVAKNYQVLYFTYR